MDFNKELRGQKRVIEICKVLGAREYINAPGGVGLYDAGDFKAAGIELKFLSEYGDKRSIFQRLAVDGGEINEVREEIYAACTFKE